MISCHRIFSREKDLKAAFPLDNDNSPFSVCETRSSFLETLPEKSLPRFELRAKLFEKLLQDVLTHVTQNVMEYVSPNFSILRAFVNFIRVCTF